MECEEVNKMYLKQYSSVLFEFYNQINSISIVISPNILSINYTCKKSLLSGKPNSLIHSNVFFLQQNQDQSHQKALQ